MKEVAEYTNKQQLEGKLKYQKIREEFVVLSQKFSAIVKAKVEDDSERPVSIVSPVSIVQDPSKDSEGVSYSHLEE
jgi:hypothetical protein